MSHLTPTSEKKELRRSILAMRRSLHPTEWQAKSQQLCQNLQHHPGFVEAKTILAYFSIHQEPDLNPLFSHSYTWGFPRCVGKQLAWHIWSVDAAHALQTNKYGIPEPHPDAPMLEPDQVDLILVPAVACDHRGYRLGYGGGFYDRLLSAPEWANKLTIGIVFEAARLPHLPVDAWDRPLHSVCTEVGCYSTNVGHSVADKFK